MLAEYTGRFYGPAFQYGELLVGDDTSGARTLSAWKKKIRDLWGGVRITNVVADIPGAFCVVGDSIQVTVELSAKGLSAEDLSVEVQFGNAGPDGWISDRTSFPLAPLESSSDRHYYKAGIDGTTTYLHRYVW